MGPIDPSTPGIAPVPLEPAEPGAQSPSPLGAQGVDPGLGGPPQEAEQPQMYDDMPQHEAPDAHPDQAQSFLPLTAIGVGHETQGEDLPDLERNWADDPRVVEYILQNITPLLTDTRSNRLSLMNEWEQIRRMKLLQHDENQAYHGRSKAYIPSYTKGANTLVSNLTRGLFPSEDYVQAVPLDDQNEDQAIAASTYVKWELEQQAKIRLRIKPMLREYVDYDLGVGKLWFDCTPSKGDRSIRKKLVDRMIGAQGASYGTDKNNPRDGIRFSARSIYHWYVYPWTASHEDEAVMMFEDIPVSRDFLLAAQARGWLNIEDISRGGNEPENWRHFEQQRLSAMQENPTSPVDTVGSERGRQIVLTEIWTSIPMPGGKLLPELTGNGSAYVEGDDPASYLPVCIVLAGQHVALVRRNPMWHQRFPYLIAQGSVEPGAFYSRGTGHNGRALQYIANDFVNQVNDNGTYAMNPGMVYNPTTLSGDLPKMRPGWTMASLDPSQVKFDRPPHEQVQMGVLMAKWALSMENDYMGVPPITQGDNAQGNASTATGAQILQQNAHTPMQDKVEELEIQVMVPMAQMIWCLGQQYRSGEFMAAVAGKNVRMDSDSLIGRYLFQWLASSQATSQQQRTKQALMLLQQLEPMAQLIAQAGYSIDPVPLLRKVYQEGFGFRGFDSFIKKMQQPPMQMGAPGGQPPGAPGGGASTPGGPGPGAPKSGGLPKAPGAPGSQTPAPKDNIRSALNVPGAPMAPGEGAQFSAVRDQADALSKANGGQP